MPKRVVDGEGVWRSKKIKMMKIEYRAEYANLIPLAEANGVFEADTEAIWADVYAFNRPDISVDAVGDILDELERVGLLRRWQENGKTWGYWEGIEKSGRLPKPSEVVKYKNLPPPPISGDSAETKPKNSDHPAAGIGIGIGIGLGSGTGLGIGLELEEQNEDGQDMNIKNLKASMTTIAARYRTPLGGYASTWGELKPLADAYGSGALITDFEKFVKERYGDEFRNGVAVAYLYAAPYRLAGDARADDYDNPEVVSLARDLTYLSGGVIAFVDKQKIRLSEVLTEFTAEEVTTVFKPWLEEQDLTDSKNVSYLAGKFVQSADSLAYTLRRTRVATVKATAEREQAVRKLQEQAEAERLETKKLEESENDLFDPLA